MTCFKKNMDTSDWLKDNTSSKWIKENPTLAKEYLKAFNSAGKEPTEEKERGQEEEGRLEEFMVKSVGVDDGDLLKHLGLLKQQIDSTGWFTKQEASAVDVVSS